jgi:hypothetical protein
MKLMIQAVRCLQDAGFGNFLLAAMGHLTRMNL